MTHFRDFSYALVVGAFLLCLTACNTVEGAGQDIRGAGQGISNAAESTKDKMEHHDDDHEPAPGQP